MFVLLFIVWNKGNLLAFLLLTEFFENKLFMSACLPANKEGITNIKRDINSSKLFCNGVPVKRIRCFAYKKR